MTVRFSRRATLLGLAASLATPSVTRARERDIVDLEWSDLVPDGGGLAYQALRGIGIVEHGQMSTPFDQETAAAVTTDYNGRRVRLPGYVVPLDFEGTAVTTFILVPYVGACIHVPPPPANQLVLVTTDEPYENEGLFAPVTVTGRFGTAASETQLAEIGYAMEAEAIEPYDF